MVTGTGTVTTWKPQTPRIALRLQAGSDQSSCARMGGWGVRGVWASVPHGSKYRMKENDWGMEERRMGVRQSDWN